MDWRVAAGIIIYRRVEWAIDSFAPYKRRGMDGIFRALLQEVREILIPYLVRIFRACLEIGYVPAFTLHYTNHSILWLKCAGFPQKVIPY